MFIFLRNKKKSARISLMAANVAGDGPLGRPEGRLSPPPDFSDIKSKIAKIPEKQGKNAFLPLENRLF